MRDAAKLEKAAATATAKALKAGLAKTRRQAARAGTQKVATEESTTTSILADGEMALTLERPRPRPRAKPAQSQVAVAMVDMGPQRSNRRRDIPLE